jgi:glycogen debranching enzyme
VLCSAADGSIDARDQGLFFRDTRVLSRHHLTIGNEAPELVSAAQPESDRWIASLRIARSGGRAEGPQLPQDALEVVLHREVGPGLLETIRVTNHSAQRYSAVLRVEVDADFADLAELHGERMQRGVITRDCDGAPGCLALIYGVTANGRRDERGLRVAVADASSVARIDEADVAFDLDLDGHATWEATLRYAVMDRGAWPELADDPADRRPSQREAWRLRRPVITCTEIMREPFERAADDLFDLRNWELEEQVLGSSDGARWVLNAGVPMFTGLFGRDVITAGWQSALLGSRALAGALDAVAASQAEVDDAWRDAEPGKLIHEMRSGPLATLGLTPRDAYYGSQTTPALFVLALSELWHWTGDDAYLRRHIDVARRALEWARRFGDLDDDGFLEYRRRSPLGLRNQAWKDSDEAIRYSDGSIVEGPTATVEEQAFYILALERMAEILVVLDDERGSADYLARARELRRRWHDTFWMADERFYAMALDGRKRRVRSIASNPGHALGAGIVPLGHARAVADRLLAPDMFSGWGVRTLSDRHPSYNPFAYHLGSVWPVEQATFALGFKRYGLDRHLDRLARAVFEAAFASRDGRLPEALTGHSRRAIPMPVPYPAANAPQAWSASALVQMIQIMLGLYPFAALRTLAIVRPRLPAWAPDLTIRGLRVGAAAVDLQFRRRRDGAASWHVLARRGSLAVIGAPPPNDIGTANWFERLERAGLDRAPGRLARAARIALGRTSEYGR